MGEGPFLLESVPEYLLPGLIPVCRVEKQVLASMPDQMRELRFLKQNDSDAMEGISAAGGIPVLADVSWLPYDTHSTFD